MKSLSAAAMLAGAAGLLLSSAAQAAVTISSVPGYANSLPALITFEQGAGGFIAADAALGFDWSGTGSVLTKSVHPRAVVPFGDTSNDFFAVVGGHFETLKIDKTILDTTGLSSLSMFIGSVDRYDTIWFYSGGSSEVVTGTELLNSVFLGNLANSGNKTSPFTNRYFTFSFDAPVDKIVFGAVADSFEFDNLNVTTFAKEGGAPEPSAWVVMLAGFGLLGMALRKRAFGGFAGSYSA
jgi:hypothetical protein